jgi:hypothetical protein
MKTLLLAATLLIPCVALAQQPQLTDYAGRAREAIQADVKNLPLPVEEIRTEVLGEPNLLANHALLHRHVSQPPPGRASLSGKAIETDKTWEPASRARLILNSSIHPGAPLSTVTSNTGEFEFSDIPPGNYELRFDGGSRPQTLTLRAERRRVLFFRDGGSQTFFASEGAGPVVLATTFHGDELVMFHRVQVMPSHVNVDTTNLMDADAYDELGKTSLPTEAELKKLRTEVAPLFAALFDVSRGPERMKPFLSRQIVCRIFNSGDRVIPEIDDERCALNILDTMALREWFLLEGTDEYSRPIRYDWYNERQGVSDEQLYDVAVRAHETLRSELRAEGIFEPDHASLVQRYFVESMTAAPIFKVQILEPIPELPLPKEELYGVLPGLFLIRESEGVRVVGVLQAGG